MDRYQPIMALRGPDRVRCRPAVIFGSDDIDGVQTAIDMLLAVIETGSCRKLLIRQHEDDSITMISHDRGLNIGEGNWKEVFCELYPDSRDGKGDGYQFSLGMSERRSLYGEEPLPELLPEAYHAGNLCMAQYSFEYLNVRVIRDGQEMRLRFEAGHPVADPDISPTKEEPVTELRFRSDKAVFSEIAVPAAWLSDRLEQIAVQHPGLACVFEGTDGEKTTYCYPEGLAGYARKLAREDSTPVFTGKLEATGKDRYNRTEYHAAAEVALCFSKTAGTRCFHNSREISGGVHLQGAVDKIQQELKWHLPDEEMVFDEMISGHLILLLKTECTRGATRWGSGRRNTITNQMIADMVEDLLSEINADMHNHRAEIAEVFRG